MEILANHNIREEYKAKVAFVKQNMECNYFEWNQSEYWLLRGRVEEASKLFKKEFLALNKLDKLNYNEYSISKSDEIIDKIKEFHHHCKYNLIEITQFIESTSSDLKTEGFREMNAASLSLQKLQEKINAFRFRYAIDNNSDGFQINSFIERLSISYRKKMEMREEIEDQLKTIIKQVNNCKTVSKQIDIAEEIEDFSYILEKTKEIEQTFTAWKSNITTYTDEYIKQINALNNTDQAIQSIEKNFSKLLSDINASLLFQTNFEDNTFSILKKKDLVVNVLEFLENAIWLLQNQIEYVQWKCVTSSYTSWAMQLISLLSPFETNNWLAIYDQFYFSSLVENNFSIVHPKSENTISQSIEDIESYRQKTVSRIQNLWSKKRKESLEQFIKNDRKLYTNLLKKSVNSGFCWFNILSENSSFLRSFYPVTVIKKHLFEELQHLSKLNSITKWNVLYLDNFHDFEASTISSLENLAYKKVLISNMPVSSKRLQQLSNSGNSHSEIYIPLKSTDAELTTPFQLMNYSERIKSAKILDEMLHFVKYRIRIFKYNSFCIISSLEDLDSAKLYNMFEDTGWKEYRKKKNEKLILSDIFVEKGIQYVLLTENGLLDDTQEDDIEWQYFLIETLRKLGVHHINRWSANTVYGKGFDIQKQLSILFKSSERKNQLQTV